MKTHIQENEDGTTIVRTGASIVKISTLQIRKYTTYRLSWRVGKKTFRRAYNDKSKALVEAERISKSLASAEGSASTLSGENIVYLRECQKKLGKVPLHSAVDFYIAYHSHQFGGAQKPLSEVITEFMAQKERKDLNLSERYLENLKYHMKVWGDVFTEAKISEVTGKRISDWFEGDGEKYELITKKHMLASLGSLLRFAQKKKYIGRDDLSTGDVELGEIKFKTPSVCTPEELMKILIVSPKEAIPYITIMAFGGSRRAELERSLVNQIHLKDGYLRLPPEVTKTGDGRSLDIPKNLKLWLELAAPAEGAIVPHKAVSKIIERVSKVGVEWNQNMLRHSFCSYHIAMHRNVALTSELAGNSPIMLRKNYKAVVPKAEAESWFSITPDSVRRYAVEKKLARLITWD